METAEACLSGWIFRRLCQKPNMWCSFHSPLDITDPIVRKRTVVCERDAVQESDPEPILTMPAHEFHAVGATRANYAARNLHAA